MHGCARGGPAANDRRGAARRQHLEQLPGYAPDLNPDEGIWDYLMRVALGNLCCRDLDLSGEPLRWCGVGGCTHGQGLTRACQALAKYLVWPLRRTKERLPIMLLTNRGSIHDKVAGFQAYLRQARYHV